MSFDGLHNGYMELQPGGQLLARISKVVGLLLHRMVARVSYYSQLNFSETMSDLRITIEALQTFLEHVPKEKLDEMINAIDGVSKGISSPEVSFSDISSLFTELHACIPDDSSIKDLHARKYKEWLTKHKQ
jgi:hypothetical protein